MISPTQAMELLLVGYLLIGLIASCWVIFTKPKPKNPDLNPIWVLLDHHFGWLLFLLWPLWLVVMLIDRQAESVAAPQEHISDDLVGHTGVVVLEFRPLGRVRVDGKLYDAMSPKRALPIGTPVRVLSQKLGELVVEEVVS